jgi:hypothetical protein
MTADTPHVAVYPCTEGLLDWVAHTLVPIDKATFDHHQKLKPIYDKHRRWEASEISDVALHAALRDFNAEHNLDLRTHDLGNYPVDSDRMLFVDAGDWILWSDEPESILSSDSMNIEYAAYGADESVRWAVLYIPATNTVTVYRSSRLEGRAPFPDPGQAVEITSLPAARGRVRGPCPTFVLPEGIEGLLTQELGRV